MNRFARSLRELVNALAEFEGLGADFVSYNEGADTTTPQGELLFGTGRPALPLCKRRAIKARPAEVPSPSDHAIAGSVGVAPEAVANLRRALRPENATSAARRASC